MTGETMATTLTAQQMKEFVRNHFEDFVNNRKADVIRKNMAPDFYDHNGPGNKPTDVKGDEDMMLGMYKAMPDLRLTILHLVADGDRVVCQNVWRRTDHQTGKAMEFHGFVMWRFEGDRIAERWATVTAPSEDQGTLWQRK
jgi:predicted ester cyclase